MQEFRPPQIHHRLIQGEGPSNGPGGGSPAVALPPVSGLEVAIARERSRAILWAGDIETGADAERDQQVRSRQRMHIMLPNPMTPNLAMLWHLSKGVALPIFRVEPHNTTKSANSNPGPFYVPIYSVPI